VAGIKHHARTSNNNEHCFGPNITDELSLPFFAKNAKSPAYWQNSIRKHFMEKLLL
jgi:hypothetical protein